MLLPPRARLVPRFIVAFLVIVTALLATTSSLAQAQTANGLAITSSTIYTPDPTNQELEVTATYTLTNVQSNELIGDSVRSFYFTQWVIAMPANVADFEATSNNTPLATSIENSPDSDDIVFGSITLPFNLNYEQTVSLEVSYTVPGGEPRAEGAVARINDSFLSFSVWAAGDPGQTDVRVNIPYGFTVDLQGDLDELAPVTRGGQTFYEAVDIDAPREFFGQVFGRNDSGLITELAELPDAIATVRAWPDDPAWADFVVDAIEDDVPILQDLIGLDWPAGDIEVIETVTPYLYGYGGWFNALSGRIEVGDRLERDLILHELGHAWFNEDLISGRWITEGLAEEFASQTIGASGDERPDPDEPDLADPIRVPLAEWASPWTLSEESAFAYEQYHYNASWWVMRQITNDIGLDAFADVLDSLNENKIAYVGEGSAETTLDPTQWTHLFDLLELQANASGLDDLFSNYVLVPADVDTLSLRRFTLASYDALAAQANDWSTPLVVRRAMAAWDFSLATELIVKSQQVLDVRDEADKLAEELGVTIDHSSESSFEMAVSSAELDGVTQIEIKLRNDLVALRDARSEIASLARDLDTNVTFVPMGYDEALANISEQRSAVSSLADARAEVERQAQQLGIVSPPWTTSSTTDFAAELSLTDARGATLSALADSAGRVQAPRTFIQRLGLLGSDPTGRYDEAIQAFESDNLDEAMQAADDATTMVASAAAAGKTRLVWVGLATVAALVVFVLATRSRRAGRVIAPTSSPHRQH